MASIPTLIALVVKLWRPSGTLIALHQHHTSWPEWDTWGTWGDQPTPDSHQPWKDQQPYKPDPPRSGARLLAAPQSRSKPLTAYSSHHAPSSKRKKTAKSSWQHPHSDQSHHSWLATSIPKGHVKVSLKDDTQSGSRMYGLP